MVDFNRRLDDDVSLKYKDMGDGTHALVNAFTADSPVELTGDVVVDTFGALDDSVETDAAAASATIPSLLRGLLLANSFSYETVAASQTDQILGGSGAAGDYLSKLLIVPATTGAGNVSIKDGGGSAISVFVSGTLVDLKPFVIELGMKSSSGAWKVTTGANVSVIGIGNFT